MISNITEDTKYPVGKLKDNLFGYPNYCAHEVTIRPAQEKRELFGTLCCCNEDWCNVNYANEPINDFSRIFELDSGTMADYTMLKHIAEKYGIY
ncbi:Replicase polyprotein 1a [Dirofilaria immitis]